MEVLLTGGSSGIGLCLAKRLIGNNHRVTSLARNAPPLEDEKFQHIYTDFSQPSLVLDLDNIPTKLDSLVYCAGINIIKPIHEYEYQDIERLQRINLLGFLELIARVSPRLRVGASVIVCGSIWSTVSKAQRAVYSASKAGLFGAVKGLALELCEKGISVNMLSPGFVDTELTRRSLGTDGITKMLDSIPMGRLLTPDEVVDAIILLLSMPRSLTGQNLVIDGGFSIA